MTLQLMCGAWLARALALGEKVAIHCSGGEGRTGLALGVVLASQVWEWEVGGRGGNAGCWRG